MTGRFFAKRLLGTTLVPALLLGFSTGAALGQGHSPDHDNGHGYDHHDDRHDDHQDQHGQDFRFRDQDRNHFASHYQHDVQHWQHNSHGRPHFTRGERIPSNYRFQPVPRSYYAEVPPPPPGYQYGYYDGYVVAYDPSTRIIADVLDLVGAAVNR
ncbi:hypothetical protein JAO29_18250 [Edaphobacter sp. HDX4]|uniref:hypothetical protein n=1 Tax=Edaphobacter sp. HDX4 TaxID=2794064 RepID=UPI002FE617EB